MALFGPYRIIDFLQQGAAATTTYEHIVCILELPSPRNPSNLSMYISRSGTSGGSHILHALMGEVSDVFNPANEPLIVLRCRRAVSVRKRRRCHRGHYGLDFAYVVRPSPF